jgi:hypothetical protein
MFRWNQAKLAKSARVALGTINSQTETLYKVQVALERGGIEFLDDDRPGVRLRASIKREP